MKKYLLPAALLLGYCFDLLFWEKTPGISFFIFVVLSLITGYFLIKADQIRPAKASWLLILPILFLAMMSFIRKEPLTTFLNMSLALFLMAVLAMTYIGGQWLSFGIADFTANFFHLIGGMFSLPWLIKQDEDAQNEHIEKKTWFKNATPAIRGVLLAIPILLIFSALLSSADLVFAKRLTELAANLKLENLPEYIFRGLLILMVGYFFSGVILYAAKRSSFHPLIGKEKPVFPPFLGFTETSIILGSVIALFSSFVLIQIEYFFFGQANITQQGFTYSEYARRGFGELVAVAVFCILLIKGLSDISRIKTTKEKKIFTGLTFGLVALVLVILISAFQRLYLYESAYGFSRSRAYAHVFIIWLGILLVSLAVMEIIQRQRAFANVALMVLLGFVFSLNVLNVDKFIASNNINRSEQGEQLDTSYLSTLSSDSIPLMVTSFSSDKLPPEIHEGIGASLACYREMANNDIMTQDHWQSFHLSEKIAMRHLQVIKQDLDLYRVEDSSWPITVVSPEGTEYPCHGNLYMD
jgi:hypothetical protein